MLTYAIWWSGEMATSCGSLSTSIAAISRYVPGSYRRTLPPTLSTATRPRVPVGLLKSMRPVPATPSFMPPPLVTHSRGADESFYIYTRGKRSTRSTASGELQLVRTRSGCQVSISEVHTVRLPRDRDDGGSGVIYSGRRVRGFGAPARFARKCSRSEERNQDTAKQ